MPKRTVKRYEVLAWAMCGLGATFYSYEYLLRIAPSVMESALRQHYALSSGGFGLLSSFYYYAYVPMQIPVGILMDRYSPRKLLFLACLVCTAGSFLFAATPYFWIAAFGRFMVGLGSAFAFVGVLKLATLWLPEDKLALVAGLAAALGTVGAMVGDNLLGFLVLKTSWTHVVNYTVIFGIGLAFILFFCIKEKKVRSRYPKRKIVHSFSESLKDLRTIASNGQIWINGFYGSLVYLPTTVLAELWGIPYLVHAKVMSPEDANFGNSMLFLGFTIGAPCMGWFSDKVHKRRLPMFIGAFASFILVSILFYMPGITTFYIFVLMFLLGMFYSSQAIVFAVGREISPKDAAGTAMAFTNMIVMLGGMFLQPLVGWLLDFSVQVRKPGLDITSTSVIYSVGDYQLALSVIPLGVFIALVLTFFLKEVSLLGDSK